tara:strand:+ start:840 stop:1115 length:276 start_codon:yes stop_codon:yes gene_type:complete
MKEIRDYLVGKYNSMEDKDSLVKYITVDKDPQGRVEITLWYGEPEYIEDSFEGVKDSLWYHEDSEVSYFKIDTSPISKEEDFSKCCFEVNQ